MLDEPKLYYYVVVEQVQTVTRDEVNDFTYVDTTTTVHVYPTANQASEARIRMAADEYRDLPLGYRTYQDRFVSTTEHCWKLPVVGELYYVVGVSESRSQSKREREERLLKFLSSPERYHPYSGSELRIARRH